MHRLNLPRLAATLPLKRLIKHLFHSAMPNSAPSRNQQQSLSALGLTFLGTASAQPSSTRNHSSLALRLGGDIWLFDCGEATQHQLQRSTLKLGKVKKVFVTHTHGT